MSPTKHFFILSLLLCTFPFLNAQNVGIGQAAPISKLDVNGGLTVGAGYSGVSAAPANGAIIEGDVGIGTATPAGKLDVEGTWKLGADGNVNNALYHLRWNWGTLNVNSAGTSVRLTGTGTVLGIPQNCSVFVSLESNIGGNHSIDYAWMEADAVGFFIRCHNCIIGGANANLDGTHYTFIW